MNDDFMEIPDSRFEEAPRDQGKAPAKPKPRRFIPVPFDKITISAAPRYSIKGLIPRTGLVVIWGAPKAGKSFFALSTAMHIALGQEFDGRKVRQGTVVYVAPEGHHGFPARVEAYRQRFLAEAAEGVPFHFIGAAINLARDYRELIVDIKAALGKDRPAAIYMDTVNRSLGGGESDDAVLGAYVDAAIELDREFECVVILIHHSGYEGGRMRGHSLLPAALDAEIQVEKSGDSGVTITVKNMRDGAEGETVGGRIELVTVGQDTEGDDITSCVFITVAGSVIRQAKETKKLPAGTAALLKALKDKMPDYGKRVQPFGVSGPEVIAVDREVIRKEFYEAWLVDGETEKAKADARRQQFTRSERDAVSKQIITERIIEGVAMVWLSSSNP